MKTTLMASFVDPATHERVRVAAFHARGSLSAFVRRAVLEALSKGQAKDQP